MNSPSENLKILSLDDARELPPLQQVGELSEFDYANGLEERLPPIKTCGSQWFVYGDGAFRETPRDIFRPAAQKILPPSLRTARRERALLDHLEGRLQIRKEQLAGALMFDDTGAILVNARNGIVRVTQGEIDLIEHSHDWNFTRSLDAIFDASATCPLFAGTLAQSLPDSADRELVQLGLGNILFPDSRFEAAQVWFGEAGSGKSTIAEPIQAVLGDGLVTRLGMCQICDPKSYSLPQLQFAAVNLGTELDSLAVDESGNFKTIVSGEAIEVRPIYGAPFTLKTTCKLWFLANGLPRFKNGTEAEMRRMRFVRFDQKPQHADVTLKARLLAEKSGVLNFMLEGLQRLMTLDAMPLGGAESREVHERFRVSNDPIGAFVRECCELDPEAKARKETLHLAFVEYCSDHNLNAELPNHFMKRVYERFPQIKATRSQVGEERVQMLSGIRVKPCL